MKRKRGKKTVVQLILDAYLRLELLQGGVLVDTHRRGNL
jgi:hypothetical protein